MNLILILIPYGRYGIREPHKTGHSAHSTRGMMSAFQASFGSVDLLPIHARASARSRTAAVMCCRLTIVQPWPSRMTRAAAELGGALPAPVATSSAERAPPAAATLR